MLPWKQSADLAHFKQITMGHPIIMGRKTYETIGRPLPGRLNIVISRNADFQAVGCTVVHSLDEAIKVSVRSNEHETFVIGGGMIFEEAISLADVIYLTQIHTSPLGDTYFRYNSSQWEQISCKNFPADEKNDYPYSFISLNRRRP